MESEGTGKVPRQLGKQHCRCGSPDSGGLPNTPESSLRELGVGRWPGQQRAVCVSPGRSWPAQPAACGFDLARLGQGALEFAARVPARPARTSPGPGVQCPSRAAGREGALSGM